MSEKESIVDAIVLITGAIVDRMEPADRRRVIADLLNTPGFSPREDPATDEILRSVAEYLQARDFLDKTCRREKVE